MGKLGNNNAVDEVFFYYSKVTAKDALDILSETRTWDDFLLRARDIGERTDQSFLSACQTQYIEDLNDRIDWR